MKLFNSVKRAQAAMEFLMTYGWAILVVLIVIGALAYFGVLSPSTLLPEKCTFPVSLTCTDHQVSSGTITLILLNGAGRDMNIPQAAASSEALGLGSLGCACRTTPNSGAVTLRNGQTATITLNSPEVPPIAACASAAPPVTPCSFRNTGRDKNRYNITLWYNWSDSPTVQHTLTGELLGRKP